MTTFVEYSEPWGEIIEEDGSSGRTIAQTVRLLKEDVIAWQMAKHRVTGEQKYENEQAALDDFLVVHWATLVEVP